MSFDRLQEKIDEMQNPTVVGLDPALEHVPPYILEKHFEKHGETLWAAAVAVCEYNTLLINALHDIVPAVKPQLAFYEALGTEGLVTFEKTCQYAKSMGMYVIGDGKRNDIGSTAEAYSAAYLGATKVGAKEYHPFEVDALTINAYLGSDGIRPFLKAAIKYDKAIFALVKTSNPSAAELQDLCLIREGMQGIQGMQSNADSELYKRSQEPNAESVGNTSIDEETCSSVKRKDHLAPQTQPKTQPRMQLDGQSGTLYMAVGDLIEEISGETAGKYGYTRVGAVVGATYPGEIGFLRARLKKTFFLVPGYGAQGGSAEDVARAFDENKRGAIINASRSIITAWKKQDGDFATAARHEALRMREKLRRVIYAVD